MQKPPLLSVDRTTLSTTHPASVVEHQYSCFSHAVTRTPSIVVKPLGHRLYETSSRKEDPEGVPFWIGGPPLPMEESDTDIYWWRKAILS